MSQDAVKTRNTEPKSLWPEGSQIERLIGRWWIAHTKPRQEKALARDIANSSGSYFLPMFEATRRSKGRSWKAVLPLFAGYVFICCDGEDQRLAALKTNRVVRLIEVADQELLVGELTGINRILEVGAAIDPYAALISGLPCRITAGPLEGVEGILCRPSRKNRFVVQVSILGQGASVEIDADLLEPID